MVLIAERIGRFVNKHILLLLLMPAFIVLFLSTFGPLLWAFWVSFTDYNLTNPHGARFTGLQTYRLVLKDSSFHNAFLNTCIQVMSIVASETILGTMLALLIARDFKGRELARSLFIIPMMTTPIVVALTWRMLFNARYGYVNYFLSLLSLPQPDWLGYPFSANLAIIIADIWLGTPFLAVLLLAGLVSLPEEPYEAAIMDGATSFQIVRCITLPLLRPVMAMAVMFRTVDVFRKFESIQILTGGGPGESTTTINFLVYNTAFVYLRMADASVQAVVLVLLMMVVVAVCIRWLERASI
jgi:multiple sugar transport system permease protein